MIPDKTNNHLQIFLKLAEEVIELGINSEDVPRRNAIGLFSGELCYINPHLLVTNAEGIFVCTGKQVKTNEN